MATALLIGTNVKAATSVANEAELRAAFADAAVSEIQLSTDINVANSIVLMDGRSIKLDLNGHNIQGNMAYAPYYAYKAVFALFHGTLQIVGNGTVSQANIKNTKNVDQNHAAVVMFGAGYLDETKEAMNTAEYENWCNLIIGDGESETKLAANGTKGAGVEVYMFGSTIAMSTKIDGTNTISQLWPAGLVKYQTNTKNLSNKALPIAAYGVNITVKENADVFGNKYGLQFSGNIKANDGNLPVINVEKGAEVAANPTAAEAVGVYAAGVGVSNINGEVHGSTGVYVKSGEINVGEGAVVYSDNNTFNDVDHKRSGVDAGGSAIIYESNKAYGGEIEINVGDGALVGAKLDDEGNIVETGAGYAIQGAQEPDASKELKGIEITGGTIVAGGMGALETQVLQEAIQDGGATLVIDGASIQMDPTDVPDLQDLLVLAGSTTLIAQTEDGEFVFEQAAPGVVVVENADLNTTAETHVELEGSVQTISKDVVELLYLVLKSNADGDKSQITIPAGKTLKVGSIVMDEDAVIDVQLGAKLIITGENGLVAKKNSNIKIAAKEGQMGIFMLSPLAKANKNPGATVTLETKAHKDGSSYIYQRIGVPAAKGMKVSDIKSSSSIAVAYWDVNTQGWAWASATTELKPFAGLAITNQESAEGAKYNFPCQLMGNTDANLLLKGDWTSFANSYMADVDLKALLADILAAGEGASASAYIYDAPTDYWKVVTYAQLNAGTAAYSKLEPMQGFIFNNIDPTIDATAVISYKNDVWNPVFAPAAIAARNTVDNTTSVQINIVAENGQNEAITLRQGEDFSAAFDNGFDAKAMVGLNPICIYANTEIGEMAEVSTDNLIGTKLNVATKGETSFTMTFSNLNGEQLAIRDNLTGSVINMVEGAEYRFAVAENSNAERFEIVAIHNAPTAVENVSAANNGAVYTIFGQYVGEKSDWNILPAGIYVVDGVKMVK